MAQTTPKSYSSISAEALLSLDSMEGVYRLPLVEPAAPQPASRKLDPNVSAYAVVLLVTALAFGLHYLPIPPFRLISSGIVAILTGILVRSFLPIPKAIAERFKFIVRRVIPLTIVLTGAGLNFLSVGLIGVKALSITVLCIVLATAAAIWAGGLLGIGRKTAALIGAGTAICGTSAIVAVGPLIEAEDQDVMLSIGTVNILGLLLMFLLPLAGAVLHLKDDAFGVWAGTTIHAVPQVLTAGFAYSKAAGALATLVKLVRVALLAPFMFALGLWFARQRHSDQPRILYSRLVPGFVWGFVGLALLNTVHLLPVLQFSFGSIGLSQLLSNLGEVFLTVSMAAMGLEVNARVFVKVGGRALVAGTIAGVLLCAFSLVLIRLIL